MNTDTISRAQFLEEIKRRRNQGTIGKTEATRWEKIVKAFPTKEESTPGGFARIPLDRGNAREGVDVLTIPIKQKWFDMIRNCEKCEEYREPTGYWVRRFERAFGIPVSEWGKESGEAWIKLRNGYGKDSPTLLIRAGIRIGQGWEKWGATPGKDYIILDIKEARDPAVDAVPDVLMFIGQFSTDGNHIREQVIEAFTCGCCYWFASILQARFGQQYGADIVVDYVANHFATKIAGRVYDITGDVTEGYTWELWTECDDPPLRKRITEDCIMF